MKTIIYRTAPDENGNSQSFKLMSKTEQAYLANLEIAKKEAYNGEYTIEDDGVKEVITPSQLDIIEAQITYTAMMTDTLLEV